MRFIGTRMLFFWRSIVVLIFIVAVQNSAGQTISIDADASFSQPKGYVVHFTKETPLIDGKIKDAVWEQAVWSDSFIDIEGDKKPIPRLKTSVKLLWNDSCLFLAAAIEEPHVWATLKKHDAIIYQDNDFEVFLDPDNDAHDYFEIEVNAFNTIFDLFMPKPYRNGGKALIPFEIVSLQSAVHVQGTLNNPLDKDSGWTIEMAIPFRSVTFGNLWKAPEEGTVWRINFSRVQWDLDVVKGNYSKKKNNMGRPLSEHNWVWSPQGLVNMHYPERWGYLLFSHNAEMKKKFTLPYFEKQKKHLWSIYYRQKEFLSRNGKYAKTLKDLGWNKSSLDVDGKKNNMEMEATSRQFTGIISDDQYGWSINDEGHVQPIKPNQ
jgi:hypothetical protein